MKFRHLLFSSLIILALSSCPNPNLPIPQTYTITYHANGADSGDVPENQVKTESVDIVLAENTGSLTKVGYSFTGWNTSGDGSGTSYGLGAIFVVDADTTLFAEWTALPTYTISYDANGANSGIVPNSQTKIEGIDIALAVNSGDLALTGFTFVGWNTVADGNGTRFSFGANFDVDADTTLFAEWTALPTYTITYDANGADSGIPPINQEKIQGIEETLALNSGDLSLTGYTFIGWNTVADGTGTSYGVGANFNLDADTVLFAEWTALPTYAITYDANGADSGDIPSSQVKIQGIDIELASNTGELALTGYSFVGWNTAKDGSGTKYSVGADFDIDAETVLFAEWIALPTYTITYDANGADSGSVPSSQEKIQGTNIELASNSGTLTLYGYEFVGWNSAEDGTGTSYGVGSAFNGNADTTLYAEWTALPTYTISYDLQMPSLSQFSYIDYYSQYSYGTNQYTLSSQKDVLHGATFSVPYPTTKRLGWQFKGWNTEPDGSGIPLDSFDTVQVDGSFTILYAQWEVDTSQLYQVYVYSPDGQVEFRQFGLCDIEIDWGDGTIEDFVQSSGDFTYTHDFGTPGTYLIKVGGWFELHSSLGGFENIVSILSWGNAMINYGEYLFKKDSMTYFEALLATDSPRFEAPKIVYHGPWISEMFEDMDLSNYANIKYWNTSKVTNMMDLFRNTTSNVVIDLSNWDVSSVENLGGVFSLSNVDFGNLSSWDTSNVIDMGAIFRDSTSSSYNYVHSWDVSNVVMFGEAFRNVSDFNVDISNWKTSSAEYMAYMFAGASSFNQDISSWYVGSVGNFQGMFENATSFDQNLANWNIGRAFNMSSMFRGVTLSTENYDAILIGWEAQNVRYGVVFDGGKSQYSAGAAAEARQRLIDDHGWVITDGGQAP